MISSILLVNPGAAMGQDIVKVFPDGTMGEIHGPMDTIEKKKFPGKFHLFSGRISTFRIGVGFLYEYAGFSEDRLARH